MRHTLFIILLLSVSVEMHAQQLPYFRNEIYAPQWHNPASFGTWNRFSLNLMGYSGGVDFSQASAGAMFSAEGFFGFSNEKSGIGLGTNYFYTSLPNYYETHTTNFQLNYQFEFEKFNISFGAAPGFRTISFDHIDWITADTIPDPNLHDAGIQTKFTLGAGVFLYTDKLYVGISSTQLNAPDYEELGFQAATQYYLNGGYRFKVSQNMQLFPSVSFGFNSAGLRHLSGSVMLQFFKPGISVGIGYSATSNIWGLIGYEYKKISFIYTAGTSFSNLTNASIFNQEIRFTYKLKKKPKCSTCEHF